MSLTKKSLKPLLESIIHSTPNGLSKDFKVSKKNPSQDKIRLFTHKNPKTRFVSEVDSKDIYFETMSAALDSVRKTMRIKGYEIDEIELERSFGTGGVDYGKSKRAIIPINKIVSTGTAKRKGCVIVLYRMDSGRYELTLYYV
jgi:hypothetical protein